MTEPVRKVLTARKLMTVVIEETCAECWHRSRDYQVGRPYFCEAEEAREIGRVMAGYDHPIPDWCPLPNAREETPHD